ncbi:MAG: rhomboid family intramembrane serine protease [Bacteroidota bacterium]
MMMTPWVLRLIIANVVVYVLQLLRPAITGAFSFVPVLILERPWTLVTYMFLHDAGGFSHILFNMLGLLFFGPRLEVELGGMRFLRLYLISGLVGALLSFISPLTGIIGASGAVYGVMFGFAYLWPREHIYVWGVFPVEARIMVIVMTVLSLMGGFGGGDNVAHFAHLGGFLGGFLYLRFLKMGRPAVNVRTRVEVSLPAPSDISKWKNIQRDKLHEVNRSELDRILDKINTSGIGSLTAQEKLFLERFSQG